MTKRLLSMLAASLALVLPLLACGAETANQVEEAGEAVAEAITPTETVSVPAGTIVEVELQDTLDSGESRVGQTFTMTVSEDVKVDGRTVIPRGAPAYGTVTAVESAGRPNKGGRLELGVDSVEIDGETYPVSGTVRFQGKESFKEDLKEIGIGGGIGAVVGGLIEGAKGAVIGGIAGAGGVFLATKGEQVELDPGTHLVIELDDDVSVPVESS